MEFFYTYVYAHILVLMMLAIGVSLLAFVAGRRGKIRWSHRLAKTAIVADITLALIHFLSYIFVQHANDLWYTLMWGVIGYWNYRQYRDR